MGHMEDSQSILAAYTLAGNIEKVFIVAITGLAASACILIGREIGAGRSDRVYSMGLALNTMAFFTGLAVGAAMITATHLLLRPYFFPLFHLSDHSSQIAVMMITVVSVIMPVRSFNSANIVGVLRGGGDVRAATLIDLLPLWLVSIPLAALMGGWGLQWGIFWVYMALVAEQIAKFIGGVWRLRSRQWINDLTRAGQWRFQNEDHRTHREHGGPPRAAQGARPVRPYPFPGTQHPAGRRLLRCLCGQRRGAGGGPQPGGAGGAVPRALRPCRRPAALLPGDGHAPVYLRPQAGGDFFSLSTGAPRFVGIHRALWTEHRDRFRTAEGPAQLLPGVWLIPRTRVRPEFSSRERNLVRKVGPDRFVPDDFSHEQSLVLESGRGLILFNSCSHGGIVNIVDSVLSQLPGRRVHAVWGGLHMHSPGANDLNCSPDYVLAVADELDRLGVEELYTGHCTGQRAFDLLHSRLGDRGPPPRRRADRGVSRLNRCRRRGRFAAAPPAVFIYGISPCHGEVVHSRPGAGTVPRHRSYRSVHRASRTKRRRPASSSCLAWAGLVMTGRAERPFISRSSALPRALKPSTRM